MRYDDVDPDAALPIVTDATALRIASTPVGTPDAGLRDLAEAMARTMFAAGGIGLAAVQVGRPVRLIVIDTHAGSGRGDGIQVVAMADPRIDWRGPVRVEAEEGCLSLPGIAVGVPRAESIGLSYTGMDGGRRSVRLDGLLARIAQHEIDHLDGILIIDHAGNQGIQRQ